MASKFSFFLSLLIQLSGLTASASIQQVPQVITRKAELSELFDILNYPARVESKVNSLIYSESDGIVTKIFAPLGTRVSKLGKLFVVKHTDPVYQYAPLTLIAPVGGIVSQVQVSEGSSVTKGQLLANVTDPNQIRVLIEVAALDLPLIKRGLLGEFIVTGTSQNLGVQVKGVSPLVDAATGTAACELEIKKKNTSDFLPPGSVGQVSFKVNQHKSFVFPDYSIVYKGKDTYLRIVQDGKAKNVAVSLGKKQRGQVEILAGIKEGDVVIERASAYVSEGEKVQVEK